MMITSETELLRCFREDDRADVAPPEDLPFPLQVDALLSWSAGPRAFLLFRERPSSAPKGIVFHRNAGPSPEAAAMCEWCHSVRGRGGVKLLTVQSGRRRIGLYLCSDLSCVAKAHAIPGVDDLNEGLDAEAKMRRILERVSEFARRRLF